MTDAGPDAEQLPVATHWRDRHHGLVTTVLVTLAVAWVVVPGALLLGSLLESLTFFGDQPTAAQEAHSHDLVIAGGIAAVALSACGIVASWVLGRSVLAFGFLLALAASLVGLQLGADPPVDPDPSGPNHCVERSGGGNDCPGG